MAPQKNGKTAPKDEPKMDVDTDIELESNIIDDELFGDALAAVKGSVGDGGLTIRKIKLKAGQSITGYFRGYVPFEYEDEDTKLRPDAVNGKIVLCDLLLDVQHPVTGEMAGITAKLTATARIMGDMAMAMPGDRVCIARVGEIDLGKKRMWDDVVRIYPADQNRAPIAVSARVIKTHAELAGHLAQSERLLPGAQHTVTTRTDVDEKVDAIKAGDRR